MDAPELLRACCENFPVVGVGGRGTNEPAVSQVFGFGFIDEFGANSLGELSVCIFDEVSPDPGDVLVIEGIFLTGVCGNRFSDEGEVAVFDTFSEDFLFEDFGVCLDNFDLTRRQKVDFAAEVVHFDYLAVGELRTIGRDSGPARGGFFRGDLCKRAAIAIDDKQSAFFAVDAFGAGCGPLERIFGVTAENEGDGDVLGNEQKGDKVFLSHSISP